MMEDNERKKKVRSLAQELLQTNSQKKKKSLMNLRAGSQSYLFAFKDITQVQLESIFFLKK